MIGAIIQEIAWQIRLKIYKYLDLLVLNSEAQFDFSFLEYDSPMGKDIEALRRLQAERKEPDRTITALELIFSNPYFMLCDTVCAEFFNLIYSARLWRDRDVIPVPDLENRPQ